ncbi:hypothetical protein Vadar_018511 [Vaccinium darrowii]|uniref:Uncharacterized protein n=1 Tax=Vaccinium darrowii TaxID=229202 RepID=A0ACB7Y0L3_9ERIC|nr:hypothetical protein Vadar_018511 [Vaccinium darrowii]
MCLGIFSYTPPISTELCAFPIFLFILYSSSYTVEARCDIIALKGCRWFSFPSLYSRELGVLCKCSPCIAVLNSTCFCHLSVPEQECHECLIPGLLGGNGILSASFSCSYIVWKMITTISLQQEKEVYARSKSPSNYLRLPPPPSSLTKMAGRAIHQLLTRRLQSQSAPVLSSLVSKKDQEGVQSTGMKTLRAFALLGAGVTGLLSFATIASADEAEHGLACPDYPWPHSGILSSYDHASIRRGHQVYQQVCASCHSMGLISYRDLVGVAYTEEETKAMAAEIEVVDGPNDEGEMFTRPGKLSDRFPQPYSNEQAARFANGGAYPPDLSLITKARHNGQNYVFALLTGYHDPPAGVSIREGLHYNPYFPGGAIAMPKMLNDGAVEYEDGTPATEAQMGKDVVTFLSWAAEPEMEERKLMGFKWIFVLSLALLQAGYYRRMKWSVFKSRKLVLDVVN